MTEGAGIGIAEEVERLGADDGEFVTLVKAHVIGTGGSIESSRVLEPTGEVNSGFMSGVDSLEWPYEPRLLCQLFEMSSNLRPNIDSYVTNIDAFGHMFEPTIDLQSDDARDVISNAMLLDRFHIHDRDPEAASPTPPSDQEIDATIEELRMTMRLELATLKSFYNSCCVGMDFVRLRRKTRQDKEVLGNAFWEIIRQAEGRMVLFNYVPSFTVKLGRLAPPIDVPVRVQASELSFEEVIVSVRFRKYVQSLTPEHGSKRTWFKEFGDPRIMSAATGKFYEKIEEMRADEPEARVATELIHYNIDSPRTPYGIPRWIGTLISVVGSRQAEEINFIYFENKSVPPLAIIVSGGRLAPQATQKIKEYLSEDIKGKKNFHKVLVIEAEPAGKHQEGAGRFKIEIKPLTQAIHSDALFQKYDERNSDKVGQQFRLPRMLRGDIRDFNKSCYSADTETLTENGWKLHSEIAPDEKIAAFDPKTGEIVFRVPESKHVYHVDEDLYWFKSPTVDCLVTDNHRMLVRNADARWKGHDPAFEVHEAAKIPWGAIDVVSAASRWTGPEMESFHLPKTDRCQIERGHRHDVSVRGDDWIEFLGYFISEGGLLTTDHSAAPYLVYVDQAKEEDKIKIKACLDRLGWTYSTQEGKPLPSGLHNTRFLFSNRCLRDWLLKNCGSHSHDKKIPDDCLSLSERQLRILLDALMLGDGSWEKRIDRKEGGSYYSSSSVLIGQVQRLLIQLGFRTSLTARENDTEAFTPSGYRQPEGIGYRVSFCNKKTSHLRIKNGVNLVKVPYVGEVYCYSVPGYGFFVTRRNGKVNFQGNTAFAALMFTEMQVFQPEREDFDTDQNRKILPDLGIKFWRFKSLAPVTRDPKTLSDMVRDLVRAGVITPSEGRVIAGDIFNREFAKLDVRWAQQPLMLTLAETNLAAKGIIEMPGSERTGTAKRLLPIAKLFMDLHHELDGADADKTFAIAKAELEESRIKAIAKSTTDPTQVVADIEGEDGEIQTIRIPEEKLLEWIIPHDTED